MTIQMRHFSRLAVCLVGVTAFFLTGCKIDGTAKLQVDRSTEIGLVFEDSDGTVIETGQTHEDFRVMFLGQVKFVRNPKIEGVTPPGGHTTCRVTSNEPLAGSLGLTESKGTYPFILPDLREDTSVFSEFQMRIVVAMLGKVIKASDDEISGNEVIVSSFDLASRGISITAQKGQDNSVSRSASPSGREPGVSSLGSDGFPV